MDAPSPMAEIFEGKARARRRFDDMPLLEKMQMALDLHRSLRIVRDAAPNESPARLPPEMS